jgi:hypothetical protein
MLTVKFLALEITNPCVMFAHPMAKSIEKHQTKGLTAVKDGFLN